MVCHDQYRPETALFASYHRRKIRIINITTFDHRFLSFRFGNTIINAFTSLNSVYDEKKSW